MTTDATVSEPTHHVTFVDASANSVGLVLADSRGTSNFRSIKKSPMRRMPLKFQEGANQWSDFELPYQSIAQDDWSGGGQLLDGDRDRSRYWHGFLTNTSQEGKVFLGPEATISKGYGRHIDGVLVGPTTKTGLYGANRYMATSFVASEAGGNYTTYAVYLWVEWTGTPAGNLKVELRADNGGEPASATLATASTSGTTNTYTLLSQLYGFVMSQALVDDTTYWVVISGDAADTVTNHFKIGTNTNGTSGFKSADGTSASWTGSQKDLYFHVVDAGKNVERRLFEYKEMMCFIEMEASGAPQLYVNGQWGGVAQGGAQSSTTLQDDTQSWTVNQWAGAIVKIIEGTGKGQYRTVVSNTATVLTVATWDVTPVDDTSVYVFKAVSWFDEVTGHGITTPVTDVLVDGNYVYFACGGDDYIRRMEWYNNAGTWTARYADDGTNNAHYLSRFTKDSQTHIIKAYNTTTATVAVAPTVTAWGNLTFGTALNVGQANNAITNLDRYGDPEYPIIFKEGEAPFRLVGESLQQIPLREFEAVRSANNGKSATVGGVYLYMSLLRGVERFYQNQLDDMGPNRDDGLQPGYQGPIVDMVSYPGKIFAAVRGEDWNTSSFGSIQIYNGLGWSSYYRSFLGGDSIYNIEYQVVDGAALDRMWISEGQFITWIWMPSETTNPLKDSNYRYAFNGMLQQSFSYMGMKDISKTWNDLNLYVDKLSTGAQFITGRYSLDGDVTRTDYATAADASPLSTITLSKAGTQLRSKSIQHTLFLNTTDNTKTPILRAVVQEAVAHLPTKFRYAMMARITDENINLRGDEESTAVATVIARLESWANAGDQLTMRHHDEGGPLDNKRVFLGPPTVTPLSNIDDEDLAGYLVEFEVYEA